MILHQYQLLQIDWQIKEQMSFSMKQILLPIFFTFLSIAISGLCACLVNFYLGKKRVNEFRRISSSSRPSSTVDINEQRSPNSPSAHVSV